KVEIYLNRDKFIPLKTYEKAVITSIQTQSLSDIKGLSNRLEKFVNDTIAQQQRQHFESTIRQEIETGTSQKKSLRVISNEISKKLGDFSRDFDRIVQYVSHQAFDEGRAAMIEKNYGEDALVYKSPFPGACKWCIKLYLTNGLGSKPIVYKLSQLKANGSNIGRKPNEWLPVVGNVHPYDRCQLEYLPDGYVWSDEEKQFVPGRVENKSGRKSKVRVEFNGKQYEV